MPPMYQATTTTADIMAKVGRSGGGSGDQDRLIPYEFTALSYLQIPILRFRSRWFEVLVRKQKWEIRCERGD
jgi:hypothetical protein